MKDETKRNSDAIEIDLGRIWRAIWHRAWMVMVVSLLCMAIAVGFTKFFITPEYEASSMFYVNNNSISVGDTSLSISQGDITAAKSLVDTYIVILNSREFLESVLVRAHETHLAPVHLRDMISAKAVNSTEIFQVTVTSEDPKQALTLATAITQELPNRIDKVVEGSKAVVVDRPIIPTTPASPSYPTNALLGFVIGFFLTVIIIALREIFDVTIRSQEDVEQCCKHPILASVPDMLNSHQSNSEYYGYGAKKKNTRPTAHEKRNALVGKDINFFASEAYKLLRTKLQFSFVEDIKCPIIGISSALAGEGKSLSSINLTYSLAQLNKRVLLIDCDMRRPSLAAKLPISKKPGLSNYLTGQSDISTVIQRCQLDEDQGFDIIASGDNPPNPIELLSSSKMGNILEALRNSYDYIIVDLPPVGEVSDAMVASKFVDGILLVVRQDYCNTLALSSAIKQFEFIETRILGVVMNCVGETTGKYYRYGKGYYSKYSKYSKYSSAYANANKKPAKRNR